MTQPVDCASSSAASRSDGSFIATVSVCPTCDTGTTTVAHRVGAVDQRASDGSICTA
jgi:hypothetical protein